MPSPIPDSSKDEQDTMPPVTKPAALQAGPRTWSPRWTAGEMMSGTGVLGAAILVLLGAVVAYLPAFERQVPVAARVTLSVVCFPLAIYFFIMAVRRMQWEHQNGGVIKRSLDGGGIILALFAAFVALVLLISVLKHLT